MSEETLNREDAIKLRAALHAIMRQVWADDTSYYHVKAETIAQARAALNETKGKK